jgi:hypothetical protein
MLAGSVLFLSPNTTYEVRLTLADRMAARTSDGRRCHTTAASDAHLWKNISCRSRIRRRRRIIGEPVQGMTAEAVVQPGDIVLVHGGSYGGHHVHQGRHRGNYVAWRAPATAKRCCRNRCLGQLCAARRPHDQRPAMR